VSTQEDAAGLVSRGVEELTADGVDATGRVVRATCFGVASAIVAEAAACSSDAILLGSRRRGHLHRLWGKGVREQVTRSTALPVLTAPAPLEMTRRARAGLIQGNSPKETGRVPT
jgi:nucleotide-binding universal stress UspA family protein